MAGHTIVPTREGDLLAVEQTLDDGDRLGQPLNPGAPAIEAQPGLLIFRLDAAGAQAELEPSVREKVDRRGFTRDQNRMAKVVVQHIGADPKGCRRLRRAHQFWHRRDHVGQVIGQG
ncbi:MAG TPA: hypothetical protein VFE41_04195 [Acetobacteraceae bacterium]|nr:hypothetical protein [Acetobacteraceae bacterium]